MVRLGVWSEHIFHPEQMLPVSAHPEQGTQIQFLLPLQVAFHPLIAAGLCWHDRSQALLNSRGPPLLVIHMVHCCAHGEFKALGGKWLC